MPEGEPGEWYRSPRELMLADILTLRHVQEDPSIATPAWVQSGGKDAEIVSLNVIDGKPLLIVRGQADRPMLREASDTSPKRIKLIEYELFTTPDSRWRKTSRIEKVGRIQVVGEGSTARVALSRIEQFLRGKGVGKYIYKTAINDLRDMGYTRVYSDRGADRSEAAERVWRSIARDNPSSVGSPGFHSRPDFQDRYMVRGYIRRRPVPLRGHARRVR